MSDKHTGRTTSVLKSALSCLLWLAFLAVTTSALADAFPVVRAITTSSEQVVLRLSAPVTFRQAALAEDPKNTLSARCYVDVSPASLGNQVQPLVYVNSKFVHRVRAAQFRPDTVRVVLDLFSAQTCHVRVLSVPHRSEPHQLVISVGSGTRDDEQKPAAAEPARVPSVPPVRLAAATPVSVGDTDVPSPQQSNHLAQVTTAQGPESDPLITQPAESEVGPAAPPTDDTVGRVLSLEEAYQLALANEEQIKIAGRELAKAQLLPWRALALLTPRADITGTYTRNKEEIAFVRPGEPGEGVFGGTVSTIRPLETWQGIFAVTQPLVQPSFLPSWRLGKDAVRQSQQQYDFTTREVLFGVARAYYDVLRSQGQVVVAQDTLRLTQDELRQAQIRFRVGEVTKTDVLRAEVAVARAERVLVENQNNLQLALTVLARAIGVREPLRVVEPTPPSHPGEGYEQLLDKAYKQRQDLRAQEWAVEVARQRKNLVLARYAPQVSAQWQFPRLNPETFANRDEFWTLFLNFQVPIFDGGVRELDLQEQNENLAQAQLQADRLRKEIRVEVKNALLTVETLGTTLETLKKEVALAQENYDITSKQYRVGLATSLDLNTSLNALNQVRTQFTDQTYAYQVALLGLDRAVGVFAQDFLPQR